MRIIFATGNAGKTSVITVGSAAWHEHSRNIPVGGKNPECLRKILRAIIFPILEVIHFLHKCRLVVTKPTFKTLWKIITGKHAADFSEREQPQRPGLVKQFRISQGIQQGRMGIPGYNGIPHQFLPVFPFTASRRILAENLATRLSPISPVHPKGNTDKKYRYIDYQFHIVLLEMAGLSGRG